VFVLFFPPQTLSAILRCFGFILLNYKIWTTFSAKSISVKTLEMYVMVFVLRFIGIRHQGYVPNDRTGDWFYHLCELVSLISILAAIYAMVKPLATTYESNYDNFGNLSPVPNKFGVVYLLVPCAVLAILFHPYAFSLQIFLYLKKIKIDAVSNYF
jgi:ER lumen protein retaining receptor